MSDSKRVWFGAPTLDQVNARGKNTMVEHLDIRVEELGGDFLKASMPVDPRTHQPMGILHGGASVALAESLASLAGNLVLDSTKQYGVGLEINANHIRSVHEGRVTGIAKALHLGKSTQVWDIRITQDDRLICVSRMTLAVLNRT